MHTMDDFESLVEAWCAQSDDPNALREMFCALRGIFQRYLEVGDEKSLGAIIKAISCFNDLDVLAEFLTYASEFDRALVPLHRSGTRGSMNFTFFHVMDYIGDNSSMHSIIASLLAIRACAPASNCLGKALAGAIMNVSHNLLMDGFIKEPLKQSQLIAKRLCMLAGYLQQTQKTPALSEDWEWELTGSDPHCGGKQAIMLRRPGRAIEQVFKPRDMVVDFALFSPFAGMGSMGLFARLNDILTRAGMSDLIRFRTLRVQCLAMETGGIEEFAPSTDTLNKEQALAHYRIMGALLFFAKLFGITDLHQDNIITTVSGPVIIDAECAFLPGVIGSPSLGECLIGGAINVETNAFVEPSAIHFTLSEAVTVYELNAAFQEGFKLMKQTLEQPEVLEELWEGYLAALRWRPTVRVVPVSTSDMAAAIEGHWSRPDPDAVIDIIMDDIRGCASLRASLREADARRALKTALGNGDIPIFQIAVRLGEQSPFLINGQVSGYTDMYCSQADLKKDFNKNYAWLLGVKADELPKIRDDVLTRIFPAVGREDK